MSEPVAPSSGGARTSWRKRWLPTAAGLLVAGGALVVWCVGAPAPLTPRLMGVSPRVVSNRTSYPLVLTGTLLSRGMRLVLDDGRGKPRVLRTRFRDTRHLVTRIPSGLPVQEGTPRVTWKAHLVVDGGAAVPGVVHLSVVDDAGWPEATDLAVGLDGRRLFVASRTTDEVLVVDRGSGKVTHVPVCDGPRALGRFRDAAGEAQLVVACNETARLWLVDMADPLRPHREVPGPLRAAGLTVDAARSRAYVSSDLDDRVHVVDLTKGRLLRRLSAGRRPGASCLGAGGRWLLVGDEGTCELTTHDLDTGASARLSPDPGVPVEGGPDAGLSRFVAGVRAPRALVYSDRLHVAFVATAGPVLAPKAGAAGLAPPGAVAVVDPGTGRFVRFDSLDRKGLPAGLALDAARGLLYVTDVARGRLLVYDAALLAEGGNEAAALRGQLDLSTHGHGGRRAAPTAIRLAGDGRTGFVLDRLAGAVDELDLTGAAHGLLGVRRRFALPGFGTDPLRRRGEALFLEGGGPKRPSCAGCHPGGRGGGVALVGPGTPRLLRVPSLLSTLHAEIPDGDGVHALPKNARDTAALETYLATLVAPPNPYHGPDGALPAAVSLPGGKTGDPRHGRALFEGKAGCARCHGSARAHGAARAPSLVDVWERFPLFRDGSAGVTLDGGRIVPTAPFALGAVVDSVVHHRHGHARKLTAAEQRDLVTYLMTL